MAFASASATTEGALLREVGNHLAERFGITGAGIALAVDEDGRRSLDTIRDATLHAPLDAFRAAVRFERRPESREIDAGCGSEPLDIRGPQVALIVEQGVMHHPKGVRPGEREDGLRCLGRRLCVRMDLAQREIAEHIAERTLVLITQLC